MENPVKNRPAANPQASLAMPHRLIHRAVVVASIFAASAVAPAAEVLQNLPDDTLAFVVVNQLGAANAKVERVLATFQMPFPGPLAFLQAATGIHEGLDPQGDLLVAFLPGTAPTAPQLAIWLPISDFEKLVASIEGTPREEIAVVTIGGEDLLIAKHGNWALLMDPEQRERMRQILAAPPAALSRVAAWNSWLETNDGAAVLLPKGVLALRSWALTDRPEDLGVIEPQGDTADDLPFRAPARGIFPPDEYNPAADAAPADYWTLLRRQLRALEKKWPLAARYIAETEAVAAGVKLDDNSNAQLRLRIALDKNVPLAALGSAPGSTAAPPTLPTGGDFIVSGAGRVPGTLAFLAANAYSGPLVEGLKNDLRVIVNDDAVPAFRRAFEQAAGQISAASVLNRAGAPQDGVYSNSFLAVRVESAKDFLDDTATAMRQWNTLNNSAVDEVRLEFETENVQVAGRDATQYSLDMAAAFGAAGIPEVHASMERLFGAGGKLRLLTVGVDDHTVLLAAATPEQAVSVVDAIRKAAPISWDERTNHFLPHNAGWRFFFSPNAYMKWLKRQMDAALGPVIGGPLVREFPASPPVGFAGGIDGHEFWMDAALPVETLRAAAQFRRQP